MDLGLPNVQKPSSTTLVIEQMIREMGMDIYTLIRTRIGIKVAGRKAK